MCATQTLVHGYKIVSDGPHDPVHIHYQRTGKDTEAQPVSPTEHNNSTSTGVFVAGRTVRGLDFKEYSREDAEELDRLLDGGEQSASSSGPLQADSAEGGVGKEIPEEELTEAEKRALFDEQWEETLTES